VAVLDPTELTRVTEYGDEIAAFVDRIVKNNFGYATKLPESEIGSTALLCRFASQRTFTLCSQFVV
jgi:hypothetical protein